MLEGMKHFVVPMFQREYGWKKKNWETLWNDILETYEAGPQTRQFLGSIVSKQLPSTPEGVSRFLLIDGQQRLTTLTLLLAAMRDAAGPSDSDIADKLNRLYLLNEFASGPERHKILPTQRDREAYSAIITGNGDRQTSRLGEAYSYFRARLAEPDPNDEQLDLRRLEQTVVSGIELVSVTLEQPDNEYRIFESLNAKGMPLTQADLIRNYFFMRLPLVEHEPLYYQVWVPMQSELADKLEDFFRYEFMSGAQLIPNVGNGVDWKGRFVREADVYQEWKNRLDKLAPDRLVEALRVLAHDALLYKRIVDPSTEPDNRIAEGLSRLNRWGGQTMYPFLLNVYQRHEGGRLDGKEFAQVLNTVESFLVRRLFAGIPTNALNRLFTALWGQLPADQSVLDGARTVLSEPGRRWPRDGEFFKGLLQRPLYTDSRPDQRRLILETLEHSYQHKEPVDLANLTVEHVMPQTLTPEWIKALGPDARNVHRELAHVLGNLTLTGYNPDLSNRPFAEKRELLRNSNLEMNKEVAAETEWTRRQIEDRGRRLAEGALKVWPGPTEQELPSASQ